MPDMAPTSLATAAVPRIGKSLKIASHVFERGENLLENSIHTTLYI